MHFGFAENLFYYFTTLLVKAESVVVSSKKIKREKYNFEYYADCKMINVWYMAV